MHTLEFFFDCSSPWTYLAFESVQKLKARIDFNIVWRPILVGGVFNQVNPSVYENRAKPVPVKARYYQKDLRDWAHYVGITIGQPPVFPVNSVKAMRGAFVAHRTRLSRSLCTPRVPSLLGRPRGHFAGRRAVAASFRRAVFR